MFAFAAADIRFVIALWALCSPLLRPQFVFVKGAFPFPGA